MEYICNQLTSMELSNSNRGPQQIYNDNSNASGNPYVEHQELTMAYDYVAIKTNYTSRIININKFFNETINNNILQYNRQDQLLYLQDNGFKMFGNVSECEYIHSIIKTDGVIVLKDLYFSDVMKVINYLEELKYCSFCSVEHITKMQLFKKDKKIILLVEIDTEN